MRIPILIFLLTFLFINPAGVFAQNINTTCDNRYLTLVNPVRSRELWFDKSLKPLNDQYQIITENNFAATWLLQYGVLEDQELINEIKKFDQKQELGIFLEVSSKLAQKARVIYPYDAAWFEPNAIFLSGYSQSERRLLIDTVFNNFKKTFGFYPKSVGAWWIDSYSLNYLKTKYKVEATMIVADQKTTDNYGVWGQWWGVPYYPSKTNILTPADSKDNKEDVVVIQWAQRDPLDSYGLGWQSSNHSLQANDYPDLGLDVNYFKSLIEIYLSCRNKVGQVTVGLETGQESIEALGEYNNQLNFLSGIKNLQDVTMSEFAKKYKQVFPGLADNVWVERGNSVWQMTTRDRINNKFQETIKYNQRVSFKDFFIADKSKFLNRVLPIENNLNYNQSFNFIPWIFLTLIGFWSYFNKYFKIYLSFVLSLLSAFGLLFKSGYQNGWLVFYGPVVEPLYLRQVLVIAAGFGLVYLLAKTKLLSPKFKAALIWVLPLIFGFDFIIQILRFTVIEKKYYFGIAIDNLHFLGFAFRQNLEFINQDFIPYQAAALLRFNYDKIWDNLWLTFLVYPLIHLLIAGVLTFLLMKVSKRIKKGIIIVLLILFVLNLLTIFNADPRLVLP